jgi:hypothetical protein
VDNICLCANPYKKFTVAVICPVRLKIELFATNKSIEYGTLEELYANKEVNFFYNCSLFSSRCD